MIMTYERGQVLNWVDGDTVDIMVDLGFFVKITVRVRLRNINTPEKGQSGFKEASDFVKQQWPVGSPIKTVCHGRDRYGRWVADLYDPSCKWINEVLLDEKFAVPDVM